MEELTTMTITRGLATLKLLDKKIAKAIRAGNFLTYKVGAKVQDEIDPKADVQRVDDLLKNRSAIKSAIMLSNASTSIKIGSVEMTVIEAIERKKSIEFEKALLLKLRSDRDVQRDNVEDVNADMQRRLDRLLEASMGSDTDPKEQKAIVESFEKRNKAELVDTLGIDEFIALMETKIDEFESEVDLCLSESNSTTTIEV